MITTEVEEDLKYLKSMTPKVFKLIVEEGFTTLRRLSLCTISDLAQIDGISENRAKNIIYQAREKLGMCEFVTVDKIEENWEWFTTGSSEVDTLMGGGITTGRITEIFGAFKSGKTNIVNTLCITVQLPREQGGLNGDVIYIDTEGTFSKSKIARIARRFGIEPKKALQRIHLAKVYSSEHQMQMIESCEKVIANFPVKLIIVDSLMALLRNEYVGIGSLCARQAVLNNIIHLLSQLAEAHNLAIVLTNQVVTKMAGQFTYEDAVGGNIVSHGCHFRYRLKARGTSYNESLEREITVVDSVDLAPGTAKFFITEAGIADQLKVTYQIKEPSTFEIKKKGRDDNNEKINIKQSSQNNGEGDAEKNEKEIENTNKSNDKLTCPACNRKYASERTLKRHMKTAHKNMALN
ncbi:MAG: DNA repair and recombination protein RadA [Promethearchaeota archaeon]